MPAVLAALLGPAFAVEVAAPVPDADHLFADEATYIARAVAQRRAEFATTRAAARRALSRLGVEPTSLVPRRDGSPRWPRGIVGSIAHTHGCCVVAVSASAEVAGVGIDVEVDRPLEGHLEPQVCTEAERAWLQKRPPAQRGRLAKLLFSAKEAAYKCHYPLTRARLDLTEVELVVDLARRSFAVAHVSRAGALRLDRLAGAFATPDGFLVTAAVLPRDPSHPVRACHRRRSIMGSH